MWMRETSSLRLGGRLGDPDEDARSRAGFERRRQAVSQPKEPSTMKGPAFWSKSPAAQHRKVRAKPVTGSRLRIPPLVPPPTTRCAFPWLRKVVYVLVAFALTLFFTLMCLISAYIMKADSLDSAMIHLGGQQWRLGEAVKNLAGSQGLNCVPCQDKWLQMADFCYLFSTEKVPWESCKEHCAKQQATFLIAHTEGEMVSLRLETRKRFIIQNKKQVHARYWVGLMYNFTAKAWLWADGTHLHIRTSVTERTALFYGDACVQFHNGIEDNRRCDHKRGCLCKRKAI